MARWFKVSAAVAGISIALGCTPDFLYEVPLPEFMAPPDKALVVVYRLQDAFGVQGDDDSYGKFYIDDKFMAANTGETVISFTVEPGRHFLFAKADATGTSRLDFKPGKVYYMQHIVFPIKVPYATVHGSTIKLKSPQEYLADLKDDDAEMKYARMNPEGEHYEDMEDDDYREEMKGYEEWLRENPQDAKKALEYPGY